jgi:hypothetical protein
VGTTEAVCKGDADTAGNVSVGALLHPVSSKTSSEITNMIWCKFIVVNKVINTLADMSINLD